MGKLRSLSGEDVCAILADQGYVEVRRRGSHAVMRKSIERSSVTIPVPLHRELRKGTLQAIIRQSGLPRSLFAIHD